MPIEEEPKLRIGQKVRIIGTDPKVVWTVEDVVREPSGPKYWLRYSKGPSSRAYDERELEPIIEGKADRRLEAALGGGLAPAHQLIDERVMGGKKFGGQAVFPALLDKSGRVVVPKEWREMLGLKGGDMIYVVLWKVL